MRRKEHMRMRHPFKYASFLPNLTAITMTPFFHSVVLADLKLEDNVDSLQKPLQQN